FAKLKLLARALERAQVYEGGRIVISYLLRTDFADVGAAEPYSEGVIDYLRAVEGADMAVLIREPPREDGPIRRVSLRASVDELDVSAIARQSGGGRAGGAPRGPPRRGRAAGPRGIGREDRRRARVSPRASRRRRGDADEAVASRRARRHHI